MSQEDPQATKNGWCCDQTAGDDEERRMKEARGSLPVHGDHLLHWDDCPKSSAPGTMRPPVWARGVCIIEAGLERCLRGFSSSSCSGTEGRTIPIPPYPSPWQLGTREEVDASLPDTQRDESSHNFS